MILWDALFLSQLSNFKYTGIFVCGNEWLFLKVKLWCRYLYGSVEFVVEVQSWDSSCTQYESSWSDWRAHGTNDFYWYLNEGYG